MPSKRKKNKRRMRRVQAQRRLLEEQYAASSPAKGAPGLRAVSAPPVSRCPLKPPKTTSAKPHAPGPKLIKIPQAEPFKDPELDQGTNKEESLSEVTEVKEPEFPLNKVTEFEPAEEPEDLTHTELLAEAAAEPELAFKSIKPEETTTTEPEHIELETVLDSEVVKEPEEQVLGPQLTTDEGLMCFNKTEHEQLEQAAAHLEPEAAIEFGTVEGTKSEPAADPEQPEPELVAELEPPNEPGSTADPEALLEVCIPEVEQSENTSSPPAESETSADAAGETFLDHLEDPAAAIPVAVVVEPEVLQQESSVSPEPEVLQQELSASPEPTILQQESSVSPEPEVLQQESSESPEPEVLQQESSVSPEPEVLQQELSASPEPEVLQQESSVSPDPEVLQQELSASPEPEVLQQETAAPVEVLDSGAAGLTADVMTFDQ
ncbi:uncharacterized protein LOC114783351 isoform X2 [Denticeps clupeoides]|uniref:uncharacterized protein LOC114783351 isoform X2 n=1 Tax=Denticeps clupeoides TaxID=299321 RepID=UPI0010A3B54C|nr:uncharacterized protein LOC114783351 isoform X2 [Denticeps clupeoides]